MFPRVRKGDFHSILHICAVRSTGKIEEVDDRRTIFDMRPDVLFDSAGDKEAEGNQWVDGEECDGVVDKQRDPLLVSALVHAVDDDEIRIIIGNPPFRRGLE